MGDRSNELSSLDSLTSIRELSYLESEGTLGKFSIELFYLFKAVLNICSLPLTLFLSLMIALIKEAVSSSSS